MRLDRHFCTLFDSNYLLKGVVMLDTLRRHCPSATVHVLCMDDATYEILGSLGMEGVERLRLPEIEDEELLRVKPGRSVAEYCWTLSAALCWYLLQHRPAIECLTYLDADLMFFSDVEPLFQEIGAASIAITEHRFVPRLRHLEAYGRFNVQWVGFRRTSPGLACLRTWRAQCIDWCFARLEDGRLGDQKYLDDWPATYAGDVHIVQHCGVGVAPWNFANHHYRVSGGQILVDDRPLIFYHFHQFQILSGGRYDRMSSVYAGDATIPEVIYRRYEQSIEDAVKRVRTVVPGFSAGIRPAGWIRARRAVQRFLPVSVKNVLRRAGLHTW